MRTLIKQQELALTHKAIRYWRACFLETETAVYMIVTTVYVPSDQRVCLMLERMSI